MAGPTTSGGRVNIEFTGSNADLQATIAKNNALIAELVKETKAQTAQMAKAIEQAMGRVSKSGKGAGDALKKQRGETKKSTNQMKKYADVVGDADSVLVALKGGIDEVNPAIGRYVGFVAEAAAVGEGFLKISSGMLGVLGPFAAGIGVVAGSFAIANTELERANTKLAEQRGDLVKQIELWRRTKEAVLIAAIAQAEVSGDDALVEQLTRQAEAFAVAQDASDIFGEQLEANRKKRDDARNTVNRLSKELGGVTEGFLAAREASEKLDPGQAAVFRAYAGGTAASADQVNRLHEELGIAAEQLGTAHIQFERTKATQKRYTDSVLAAKDANRELAEQTRIGAEALRVQKVALEGLNASLQRQLDIQELNAQFEGFAEQLKQLDPFEQIAVDEQKALDALQDIYEQRLNLADENYVVLLQMQQEHEEEKLEVEAEFQRRRAEQLQKESEKNQKELKKARDAEMAAALEVADVSIQAVNDLADFTIARRTRNAEQIRAALEDQEAQLTDAQREELEDRLAAEQKAAVRAHRAKQLAGIASVAIDTAAGIQKVIAQWGLPWGLIPAAAVVAGGVAQAAVIGSQQPPKFHTGTSRVSAGGAAPDEFSATLTGNEAILTGPAADAVGRSNIDRLNGSQGREGGMFGPIIIQPVYGHRLGDRQMQDTLKLPNSAISRAIRGDTRVGHRDS